MTLLAVPNVSEGRNQDLIARCVEAVLGAGAALLDLHTDEVHNRSVLTLTAAPQALVEACTELARAATGIDLRNQRGVHPRLGGLDVCPFVPHGATKMPAAIAAARVASRRIGSDVGLPVFLYDRAAREGHARDLPALRSGGLEALSARVRNGLAPDEGPDVIDPARGVVCVGARGPLIAFNVWLDSDIETARRIASEIRSPSVRALGLPIHEGITQVSMNLVAPERTGIETAFAAVASRAAAAGVRLRATEIVGLVEERFLPDVETTATRLLLEPGRSVEEALELV